MSVTRLTIDLQRPVPVGPLDIDVNITREGRNIQTSEVILSANGKQVVRASGAEDPKGRAGAAGGIGNAGGGGDHIPETPIGFPRAVGFNTAVEMRTEDPAASLAQGGLVPYQAAFPRQSGDDAADAGGGDGRLLQWLRLDARF
jgi:hypothetical protein